MFANRRYVLKLVLINTPVPELKDDRLDPPMGLLNLAGYVKDIVDVQIIDLAGGKDNIDKIPEADYYGFSTYTSSYYRTVNLAKCLKQRYPKSKNIAGGAHVTALPQEGISDFDYVVTGEGENALANILQGNLNKGVYQGMPVANLDRLDFPNYDLVDINSYNRLFEGKQGFQVYTSRGCSQKCAFCSSDTNVRRRSVSNVLQEIFRLQLKYGDISIRFKDDLFASKLSWIKEFADNEMDIRYSCNIRGDCRSEIIEQLAKSGCSVACLGIESGSDVILKNMKKGLKVAQVIKTVKTLKDYGIQVLGWFVVGFPGETWDTVKETVDFINGIDIDKKIIYPLIPYPGTDVYDNADKYGIRLLTKQWNKYFYIMGNNDAGYVYETDTLNPEIIKEMRQYVIDNIPKNRL